MQQLMRLMRHTRFQMKVNSNAFLIFKFMRLICDLVQYELKQESTQPAVQKAGIFNLSLPVLVSNKLLTCYHVGSCLLALPFLVDKLFSDHALYISVAHRPSVPVSFNANVEERWIKQDIIIIIILIISSKKFHRIRGG